MSAYLESDSMAPDPMVPRLRLLTEEDVRAIDASAQSLGEQLLYTAVLQLMRDVKRLKQKVADLEGRECI